MMLTDRRGAVTAHPDLHGLPGSNVLQQLVNGAEAWALAIALLGAFIGAGLWAIASHCHNHHYAARGRMAALISAAAALIVGAAPGLVNFFQHLGTTARVMRPLSPSLLLLGGRA